MAHDKYESCYGCPDRCPEPNCHDTCEGYKHRQEEQSRIKAERKKYCDFNAMKAEVIDMSKKRTKNGTLRSKLRSKG